MKKLTVSQKLADAVSAKNEWQALLRQGEAVSLRWVMDGLLVPSGALAATWGRTRQSHCGTTPDQKQRFPLPALSAQWNN